MRNGRRRTVTAEVALQEEFDLFVVGVAGNRAGGTYSTRGGTGVAEVDSLFDWPPFFTIWSQEARIDRMRVIEQVPVVPCGPIHASAPACTRWDQMNQLTASPCGTCDYSVINSSILLVDHNKRRLTLQDPQYKLTNDGLLRWEITRVVHIPRECGSLSSQNDPHGCIDDCRTEEDGQLRTGELVTEIGNAPKPPAPMTPRPLQWLINRRWTSSAASSTATPSPIS